MSGADTYTQTIRELSDRIVDAQRPIRVLGAINWDDRIKQDFFAKGFKEQPKVDHGMYEAKELRLDPGETRNELRSIEGEILGRLGPVAPASVMMRFMCEQYRLVVDMLEARGTEQFAQISGLLYGTPKDVFHAGGPTIADLAAQMRHILEGLAGETMEMHDDRSIDGHAAMGILQRQLDQSM